MANLQMHIKEGITHLRSSQLSAFAGLRHAFFTREGGVSQDEYASLNFRINSSDEKARVMTNYDTAVTLLGTTPQSIEVTTQRHTDIVQVVSEARGIPVTGEVREPVDALITAKPGICLTGFYADCQLLLIYEHKRKVCAVAHCGWRGIASELARKTIERMTAEFGCRPGDMTVAVGPSICRRCFETDGDVPEQMFATYGEMIREYIYKENGKWHVDLKNITYSMLLRCGVHPYNIDISNECTCCGQGELFWSHRKHGENRGVHAGMIMMTSQE